MVQSYAIIPLAAVFFYTLLFCMFFAAKRDKLLTPFMILMLFLLIWAGGSLLMRIQFLGNIRIWYHVSLCGIWLACITIEVFLCRFAEKKVSLIEKIIFVLIVCLLIGNIITEWFLAPPVLEQQTNGTYIFIYEKVGVGAYLMYGLLLCIAAISIKRAFDISKVNGATRSQFVPIIIGMFTMYLGNFVTVLPVFSGVPIDIAAGVLFSLCFAFSLYYKHLFSLTMAFSKGTYAVITAMLVLILASQYAMPLEHAYATLRSPFGSNSVLFTALTSALIAALIYIVVKKFCENVFLANHNSKSVILKEYQERVSGSLSADEVSQCFCNQILESLPPIETVRVCEVGNDGSIFISSSSEMLESGKKLFKPNSSLFEWLSSHHELMTGSDFARSFEYRGMWEQEKYTIHSLNIDYYLPMYESDELMGVTLLTLKDKRRILHVDSADFLVSLNAVTSVSLKNSRLYEKAVNDAQTDDLTGLLNRKYFLEVLNKIFAKRNKSIISLLILSLDDFKLYNQLYGVKVGDITLQNVAKIIKASVGEDSYVARYSGKEFAILLPNGEASAAARLAEKLRLQILDMNKSASSTEHPLKIITCSIGICSIPFGANSVTELLNNVDLAVFQAKQNGKNAVSIYSVGMVSEDDTKKVDRKEVYSSYANTIFALCAAIDAKDHYTFTHSNNVAYYAASLAEAYGLNADTVEIIREAALLHDVGKIGIPESILNKAGPLTGEEYEIMKKHPENAIEIIRHLPSLDYVIPAVLGHHERWDGKGYPRRLAGEDIPLSARILCVADCFDAITSRRCYQDGRSVEDAIKIMESNSGSQFDPKLVALFIQKFRDGTIKLQLSNVA